MSDSRELVETSAAGRMEPEFHHLFPGNGVSHRTETLGTFRGYIMVNVASLNRKILWKRILLTSPCFS